MEVNTLIKLHLQDPEAKAAPKFPSFDSSSEEEVSTKKVSQLRVCTLLTESMYDTSL